ncbi:hypothetical protein DID73_00445 [Candidatus Marinamargulisbacteria bacterium SCGC AG-343-K17]|nr:hypothetical protein DID73_00445 [Candidatus Marinamargulisbacteria bacterium SCGC AG-343-K17]
MKRLLILFICLFFGWHAIANEKEVIIQVPSEMTVEMIVANDLGLLNGTYDVRARIYDPITLERLWFEDYKNHTIEKGAFVLTMNSVPSLNAYSLHKKLLKFVVTVGNQSVEIPLLTEFFSYRSLFAEFGWDTRFPSILYIDRTKNYLGIGMDADRNVKGHVDVRGALKIGYEDTNVTGSIRWAYGSMWVKHPNQWVNLLYGPTTFKKSRWRDFTPHIELASPNYKIGIGTKFPQEKLHVIGTGYFSGGLRSTSLKAQSLELNSLVFNDTVLKVSAIYLKDGANVMEWTSDNLRVPFGQIVGDGSGLTNVGQDLKDFDNQMIQHIHLDGGVVSSRNLQLQAIQSNHIADHTILIDRLNLGIFNGDYIGDNSITSDNIMLESLTFDMLITNNVTEYIPDQFFASEKIASNSVYVTKIKDEGIASYNIKASIIGEGQLKDNIILGDVHVMPNSIVPAKFKSGEIKPSLFSGLIGFSTGGTGISSLTSDRVLAAGNDAFNGKTNLVFNSSNNLGVFGTSSLTSLQEGFTNLLNVESLTGAVSMALRDSAASEVQIGMVNPSSTFNLTLNNTGQLSFDIGSNHLFFHSTNVISTSIASSQEQLDLGAAITIGDATNSQPSGGTMEYEAVNSRFRFYDGTDWKLVTDLGYGIGNPIAIENNITIEDSFVGAIQHSNGTIQSSMLGSVSSSVVNGEDLHLGRVLNADIDGQSLYVDMISDSHLSSQSVIGHQLKASNVTLDHGVLSDIFDSQLQGRYVQANDLQGVDIDGDRVSLSHLTSMSAQLSNSRLLSVSNSTAQLNQSVVFNGDYLKLRGDQLSVIHSSDVAIDGHSNDIQQGVGVSIDGDSNVASVVSDVTLSGDDNMLLHSKDVNVYGNHNRVFGSSARINGEKNVGIGDQITMQGDRNVAINASDQPLAVDGDSQVVLSAPNGVFIHTGDGMVVSATDVSGGWTMVSDQTLKTQFSDVDHQEMFNLLMALPVSKWEYVFKKGVKHVGPMAQDFKSAFNIGEDERFITSTDADGVAFSAIKYLIQATDQLSINRSKLLASDLVTFDQIIDDVNIVMDSLDRSMTMKQDALTVMVDKNLEQYQMIDKQLKVLSRYKNTPTYGALVFRVLKLLGLFLMSIVLGFYSLKLYDKKER